MEQNLRTRLTLPNGVSFWQPTGLFINNQFVAASDNDTIETVNPSTGKVITSFSAANQKDVTSAIKSARDASKVWSQLTGHKRSEIIYKFCDLLQKNSDAIASIETLEGGKPFYTQSRGEVQAAIQTFRYYAGWADKLTGDFFSTGEKKIAFTKREPLGVCALIVPWNFPFLIAAWKIAPAIAAGNCVVVKPSELTSLSLLYVCQLIKEAGFPNGVINVVPGLGSTTGQYLSENEDVNKISFTGSTATAKKIIQSSKTNLKEVSLECGGKSPMIVLADADLEKAATLAHSTCMSNMGQICSATSRVYVHESVYEEFLELYKNLVGRTIIGDPFEEKTFQGPQISVEQKISIEGYVRKGVQEGAKILDTNCELNQQFEGFFVKPIIFYDVEETNTVMKEEIFGPVVAISSFKTTEEAIKKANNSCYGLAASIFTNDLKSAHSIATKLQTGQVFINTANDLDVGIPFGGVKASGTGRDLGADSLLAYTKSKAIHINIE